MKVTVVVLEVGYEFWWDSFLYAKENCLLKVAAILVGVELLDVEFSELVGLLVSQSVVE